MPPPLITLTTDFGTASPYVAVMKGVILSINPAARITDLTHAIRAQDLRHASYFLATAVPYFPPGTIHLCVVDPGVGSERAALYAEAGGQRFVGPDNGIFTGVFRKLGSATCRKLANCRFWRPGVSATFHGRDIFAPVAAHLSLGANPNELGQHPRVQAEVPAGEGVGRRRREAAGAAVGADVFRCGRGRTRVSVQQRRVLRDRGGQRQRRAPAGRGRGRGG
jgi:S-adenosylmethionine hydrolase